MRAKAVMLPLYAVAKAMMVNGGMQPIDFCHLVMSFDVVRM